MDKITKQPILSEKSIRALTAHIDNRKDKKIMADSLRQCNHSPEDMNDHILMYLLDENPKNPLFIVAGDLIQAFRNFYLNDYPKQPKK